MSLQKIITLSPAEARKIAAGQVVDRPANVVKELVENALDAGATTISVTIKDAGQTFIRVVDNGCGMSEYDALQCFEHHSTSKISQFADLETLKTYGFRGEALASIAAVSVITLETKEADSLQGNKVISKPGENRFSTSTACNQGTDITIADLFFNVPVRKKFLKKEETESRAIISLMQAFCLAHPEVHFQLFSGQTTVLNCPKVSYSLDRVTQLWDHGLSSHMVPLVSEKNNTNFSLHGFVSNQQLTRYNRNQILFFVNRRWVKNYQLSQALLKGYSPTLQQGRYPVAFIHLEVPAKEVDINVHPRKEEVAFMFPLIIEKAIQNAVRLSLEQGVSTKLQPTGIPHRQNTIPVEEKSASPQKEKSYSLHALLQTGQNIFQEKSSRELYSPSIEIALKNSEPNIDSDTSLVQKKVIAKEDFYIIGVFHKTYIMVETQEGILMVDQHAAHERILYEQFSKRFDYCAPIRLLFPEVVSLAQEEYDLINTHLNLFEHNNILIEPFGERQMVIQATPPHLKNIGWHLFLKEMVAIIQQELSLSSDFSTMFNAKLQAQMACKAAVKAGDILSNEQMQTLLHDLEMTDNRFSCPHGRPTTWLLPLYEIEKKFKRKV